MPRTKRRSLLCCLLALFLVNAFTPWMEFPHALNTAYAKKTEKKKRKKKPQKSASSFLLPPIISQPARNYVSFPLTTTANPVVNSPSPRSLPRATRIPSVHILPVQKIQVVNSSQTVFSNFGQIDISAVNSSPDPEPAVPYPSDIDVLGLTGVVTHLSVTINGLTHSAPDDLDMLLLGPSGQTFHFWSDVGGNNPVDNLTVTVSDEGDRTLPDSAALVDGGTYRPFNADTSGDSFPLPAIGPPYNEPESAGSATFASVFNGLTADQVNGTWSLFITDDTDGNGGTIARGWSLNITTAQPQTTSGQLVISEFRLRGPNGANDEFIEVYNSSGTRLITQSADDSAGLGIVASDGLLRCTIPNGTVFPINGHYLCANVGALLPLEADATYAPEIPDNAGIAIFNNVAGNYDLANRIDAVGSSTEANAVYKEGIGFAALAATNLDYSFVRNMSGNGLPRDTNDNAADFIFIDPTATNAGAGARLGAPGPENLASPTQQNANFLASLMLPCLPATLPPNRIRDLTPNPGNNSTFGTLSIRRVITNNTVNDVTRLRFRIIDITTTPAPPGIADLRVLTSSGSDIPDPCTGGAISIAGLTLETPPAQSLGGGLNSTLAAGTINLETPLPANSSIAVDFLLGVQQPGRFRFFVNVEALP